MENTFTERDQASLSSFAEESGDPRDIAYCEGMEHCRLVCTACEDQVCQIVHFLPMCNKLLFHIGMQLREERSASLSLVSFRPMEINLIPPSSPGSYRANIFLRWLLRSHICITGLKLRDMFQTPLNKFVFDELPVNARIKKLRLHFTVEQPLQTHITKLLPRLLSLEELSCCTVFESPDALVPAISVLLRATTCLTSLAFEGCFDYYEPPNALIDALVANSTLKSLDLSASWKSVTAHGPFGEYVRSNRVLTSLKVFGDDVDREGLSLVDTVVRNGTLSALEISNACGGELTVRSLTRIIAECTALKELTICEVRVQYAKISKVTSKRFAEALAENETLEELTLPYALWHRNNWIAFFSVLPRNRHLKQLEVSHADTADYATFPEVLEALAQEKLSARVSFTNYIQTSGINLMSFSAFSSIDISGEQSVTVDALQRLPALDHFTCVSLDICESDESVFSCLANYIQSTTALRELHLGVANPLCVRSAAVSVCWAHVFGSVLANTSIAYLGFTSSGTFLYMDVLARTIGLSRTITRAWFQLGRSEADATGFVVPLSETVGDNYNLLEVSPFFLNVAAEATWCWFTITETMRRNSGLVERAAAFKDTSRLDWYTAAALEKVSRHPALLKELAEKEGMAACEVARMVRSRLRSVEGLHDFMRLTGVVKERVTCAPPVEVCSKQLDDLNTDCWLLLRQYLSFDDIKRSANGKPDKSTPS